MLYLCMYMSIFSSSLPPSLSPHILPWPFVCVCVCVCAACHKHRLSVPPMLGQSPGSPAAEVPRPLPGCDLRLGLLSLCSFPCVVSVATDSADPWQAQGRIGGGCYNITSPTCNSIVFLYSILCRCTLVVIMSAFVHQAQFSAAVWTGVHRSD